MRITKAKLQETIDRLAAELVTAKNEAEDHRVKVIELAGELADERADFDLAIRERDEARADRDRAFRDRELALGDRNSRFGLQVQLDRLTKEFAEFRHEGDRVVAQLQAQLNIETVSTTSERRNTQKVLDGQAEEIKSLRGRIDSTVNAHVHATETHNFQIHIKDEKILALQNALDQSKIEAQRQLGAVQGMTGAFEALARGLK